MTEREKIDAAVDYLVDRKVPWQSAAPPHYRVAWWLGFCVPPPHFQSFLGLLAFNGTCTSALMAILAVIFERHNDPVGLVLTLAPIVGAAAGLLVAVLHRVSAWRLGLPHWSLFRPEAEVEEDTADW